MRFLDTLWRNIFLISLLYLSMHLKVSIGRELAPEVKEKLFTVDAQGGKIIRFPGFDLRHEGAKWDGTGRWAFDYQVDPKGISHYRLRITDRRYLPFRDWSPGTPETIEVLPNRDYIISVLLDTDFERAAEINLGLKMIDHSGAQVVWNLNGLPNKTKGWTRWEWKVTADPRATHAVFQFLLLSFSVDGILKLADVAVIELPPKKLKPYHKGTGATFRGGPGNLPMKIENVTSKSKSITVDTTGASYIFDLDNSMISQAQRIETPRTLSQWKSSLSLDKLEVILKTSNECVLANDKVTFGIQCDGLLMIVPHENLILRLTSQIGGKWNRLAQGHLLALDDYGGFSVNPDIPFGTGRRVRVHVGKHYSGLGYGRINPGQVDFMNTAGNVKFISCADKGWLIDWHLVPGERLGISVCPPRPFPWKESFEQRFTIVHRSVDPSTYRELAPYADTLILWNFTMRGWSFSFGREHIPYDADHFKKCVKAAKDAGMHPIMYASSHWYYSRDAQEYVNEIMRMKNEFGIEGLYLDGIPGQEWIVAYEQMRMLRELFSDGRLIIHATGDKYNGNPPLCEPALKVPIVETYANSTYTGELIYGEGNEWAYPKYITRQYRLSNCIGVMKYDKWDGLTPLQRDMQMLKWNGRTCLLPVEREGNTDKTRLEYLKEHYFPILEELKKLWMEKGNEEKFYEKYYLPKYEELTRNF